MDDQGGIDHEEMPTKIRVERAPGATIGQAEADGGGEASDPRALIQVPWMGARAMEKTKWAQEEPTQETIRVPPSSIEKRRPGVDPGPTSVWSVAVP